MSTEHNCWKCGTPDVASLFCRYCNSLQAPIPNYYEFFGLDCQLSLNPDHLQKQFYQLSRLLHPDRYTRRSEQEKHYSLQASSILNDAYRVLRDPIRRSEYVLNQAGFEIGDPRNKEVPPELLEEVFELNMALDELRMGDTEVLPQLDEMRQHFMDMMAEMDGELETQFLAHDAQPDDEARRKVLTGIRAILNRRRYIRNLVDEVDKQLTSRNA
ncbi:MAG TPA: Fe-S protein assembly co-chaperone HscB [Paludibaculum sp.]|jgi:molecular chaperone HscB